MQQYDRFSAKYKKQTKHASGMHSSAPGPGQLDGWRKHALEQQVQLGLDGRLLLIRHVKVNLKNIDQG